MSVMTAASIGAAKGGGYARYLESKTVKPGRGDYYLSADGETAQAPGRWLSHGETLAKLGVEAGEPAASPLSASAGKTGRCDSCPRISSAGLMTHARSGSRVP